MPKPPTYTQEDLQFLESLKNNPIAWSETFLINPNSGLPFRANYPQRQVMNSTTKYTYYAVHRRCVAGSNLVINGDTLRPQPIRDSNIESTIVFDFESNKSVRVPCSWTDSGQLECLNLKFGCGSDLTITKDHLLFDSKRGWLAASKLKVGDKILAPRSVPVFGDRIADNEEINRLALLTQLGNTIPDSVYLLNEQCLRSWIQSVWAETGLINKSGNCISFMLHSKQLSLEIQHILHRFGIESQLDTNILQITDLIDCSQFLNLVCVEAPIYEVHSPRRWEIIIETNRVGLRDCYDLTVNHTDYNFLVNGVIVHNSGKSYSQIILSLYHAICFERRVIDVFSPSSTQISQWFQVLDEFIKTNPVVEMMHDKAGKNSNVPEPHRSFVNGSKIRGHIMALGAEKGKAGITSDVVFVDEAQDMSVEAWRIIDPIIIGDLYRTDQIKAYITGTIKEPSGKFYEKIFKEKSDKAKRQTIIKIPIKDNIEYTEEQVEQIRLEIVSGENGLQSWISEYMLELGSSDMSLFPKRFIDAAQRDYKYGPHLVNRRLHRFVGVDWDKVGAGTNIVVVQYNQETREVQTIWREEIPQSEFTYTIAVNRLFEIWDQFAADCMIVDAGSGEMQYEQLKLGAQMRRSTLMDRLVRLPFNTKIEVPDIETGDLKKIQSKLYLVSMLKKKLEEGQMIICEEDTLFQEQLAAYKIILETSNTVKFSNKNEHIIDCHLFALYGVYSYFENYMSGEGFDVTLIGSKTLNSKYIKSNNEQPRDQWNDEYHTDIGTFYGPDMVGSINRSNLGKFNRQTFGNSW